MSNFPPLSGHRPGTAVPGDGAFAVPSSVTWEDGLGDDDLEVVAPEPSAVPARPSLPTRSLRRTPVASPVPAAPAPVAVGVACPNVQTVMGESGYPREALRQGLEKGSAIVEWTVTAAGEIKNVRAVGSTNQIFARQSIRLIGDYKCVGQGRDVTIRQEFNYKTE